MNILFRLISEFLRRYSTLCIKYLTTAINRLWLLSTLISSHLSSKCCALMTIWCKNSISIGQFLQLQWLTCISLISAHKQAWTLNQTKLLKVSSELYLSYWTMRPSLPLFNWSLSYSSKVCSLKMEEINFAFVLLFFSHIKDFLERQNDILSHWNTDTTYLFK